MTFETEIRQILQNISATSVDMVDNEVLLPRDILLNAWILQKRHALVNRKMLNHLVGEGLTQGISALLKGMLIPSGYFAETTTDYLVLHNDAMKAIEKVFNDPKLFFNISSSVAFMDGIKGYELMEFLSLAQNSSFPIQEIFRLALLNALDHIEVRKVADGTYVVTKNDLWDFMLVVLPVDGAFSRGDLLEVSHRLRQVQNRQSIDWHVLLVAPICENLQVYRETRESRLIHHLTSVSAVRFFNRLKSIIGTHGSGQVTQFFPTIFPVEEEATFSSTKALDTLEANFQ